MELNALFLSQEIISLMEHFVAERQRYDNAITATAELSRRIRKLGGKCRELIAPPVDSHRTYQEKLEKLLARADNDTKRDLSRYLRQHPEMYNNPYLAVILDKYDIVPQDIASWEYWRDAFCALWARLTRR